MRTRKLPANIVVNTLSNSKVQRQRTTKAVEYNWHVSDVVNTDPSTEYCARQKTLLFHRTSPPLPRRISPGMQMLFDVGNFYHDQVRDRFIQHSDEYGQYAFGGWRCIKCAATTEPMTYGQLIANPPCGCKSHYIYEEIDLYSKRAKIVGHPDLIIFYNGVYYIYEIKTIDRQDIVFADLESPLFDHQLQASMYYALMKMAGYKVSKYIRFVYVDRSVSTLFKKTNIKEFKVERLSGERLTPFFQKAMQANKGISTGVLPERICEGVDCSRAKNCQEVVECFERRSNVLQVHNRS